MAISYIVGIPRSGKSYLAVYKLWKHFIHFPKEKKYLKIFKPKVEPKKDYFSCYTNINKFDFSKSNKLFKLDFDDFKASLSDLYFDYKAGKTDDELIEKAKEFNIYKTLFVIDECHNFLTDRQDKVLTWWLTYHGHLYQDIYLITQDLDLVSKEYKKIAEFFYKAVPPSKRFNTKKFRYVQYSSYKMFDKDIIQGGGYTLPALQEVFDLYQSGDRNNSKSIIHKYLKRVFILLLILIPFFKFGFLDSFSDDTKKSTLKDPIKKQSQKDLKTSVNRFQTHKNTYVENQQKDSFNEPIEYIFLDFFCVNNMCIFKDVSFPYSFFKQITYDKKISFYQEQKKGFYTRIFLHVENIDFFQKILTKASNEQKNSVISNSLRF